jgi:polyhydroxyalkanoate synthesis regulator phasin
MAQNDSLKRYLDAGMAFTQLTRDRAEAIIKDFVKAGEIPRKRANESIEDLLERSRKNTEALVALVQEQVKDQLGAMGIATKDDIARLEAKISRTGSAAGATTVKKAAPAKKAPAKKAATTAKKAPAAKKA